MKQMKTRVFTVIIVSVIVLCQLYLFIVMGGLFVALLSRGSWGGGDHERNEFIGVYYYEHLHKKCKDLNYLILQPDSTYKFVYVSKKDTLVNIGKWDYVQEGEHKRVRFYDWRMLGKGKELAGHLEAGIMLAFYESPALLGFDPDTDVDFWRIDSVGAAKVGIKEDGITWATP